jgi:osmotically-inducible protein OsmY
MGVSNLMHIKSRVQVPDLKKRIEDALKRCAELEAKTIRVSVKDGEVTLEGRVRAWSERDALESAVWGAPGVKAVKDRVTIGS